MSQDPSEDEAERPPIPYARQCIDETDIQAVVEVLKSDFVAQGPAVARFEAALAEYCGARFAVVVSSGTAALHLVCKAMGLGADDCGLVPAITFAATANCLRYCDSAVQFVDVSEETGRAGAEHFEAALREAQKRGKPRLFLPVSYSGQVSDLDEIASLARSAGAMVVEDAAHSLGAKYRRADGATARSGSCRDSDAAILSFHPVKHICAGEGGAVLTNDADVADRVRTLRAHGIRKTGSDWRYDQVELGFNYRMTDMQAALGLSQLKKLDSFMERRRALARRYGEAFSAAPFAGRLNVPEASEYSAWHLFVVRFSGAGERRAAYEHFHRNGIRVQVHYSPVYRHRYYKDRGHESLSGAESFASSCLSLPLYPSLSDSEQNRVIACLAAFFER